MLIENQEKSEKVLKFLKFCADSEKKNDFLPTPSNG
jgi:hypothetical protein